MAIDGRGFREIDISIRSVISSKERFPKDTTQYQPGRAEIFRNNLVGVGLRPFMNKLIHMQTALSQYHNLYFVADWGEIRVYEPQFPSQQLQLKEFFKIALPFAGTPQPGFIDPDRPHAPNHIFVGDLGIEEVLVCACDDGDVVVYRTSLINQAIKRRESNQSDETTLFHDIEIAPFFITSVRTSAWGITTHKVARMLAISANTYRVTVFAFALGFDNLTERDERSYSSEESRFDKLGIRESETSQTQPSALDGQPDRSRDIRLELRGHNNIPSIAFCNTEDDVEGRYLVSTDISGLVIIWDVWIRAALKTFSPNRIWRGHGISGACPTRGWSVLCLDPRAFRPTDTDTECFGCRPRAERRAWIISHSRQHARDSSPRHPSLQQDVAWETQHLRPFRLVADRLTPAAPDTIDTPPEAESRGQPSDTTVGHEEYLEMTFDDSELELDEEDDLYREDEDDELYMDVDEDDPIYDEDDSSNSIADADDDDENPENMSEIVSTLNGNAFNPQVLPQPPSRGQSPNPVLPKQVPFMLFWASDHSLALFAPKFDQPATVLVNILHQELPLHLTQLGHYDRLNMIAQIPELGIIAIASQIGRVALLTLTSRRGHKGSRDSAFRLDWILPLKSQEEQGQRPNNPLLGIAMAPIQGQQLRSETLDNDGSDGLGNKRSVAENPSRRYRLMLTYYDMSVLSYEIGRTEDGVGEEEVPIF